MAAAGFTLRIVNKIAGGFYMKIAIFGLGGIGGAFGGALARKFPEDITFIARGERGKYFAEHGITIKGDKLGEFTARPALVTDNPA